MQREPVEEQLVARITDLSVFFLFASLPRPHLRNEAAADGNRLSWWFYSNYAPTEELSDCRLLVCNRSVLTTMLSTITRLIKSRFKFAGYSHTQMNRESKCVLEACWDVFVVCIF